MEFNKQSLAVAREIGDKRLEGIALVNMSTVLSDLGRQSQAISCANDALAIFEKIEDPNASLVRLQLLRWSS